MGSKHTLWACRLRSSIHQSRNGSFASNQAPVHPYKASSSRYVFAASVHSWLLRWGGDKKARMERFKASYSYTLSSSDRAHANPVIPAAHTRSSGTLHQEQMGGCVLSTSWLRRALGTSLVRHSAEQPGKAGVLHHVRIWPSSQAAQLN